MSDERDAAYLERNRLVALLAALYPSGIARTAIPGWSEDWHGCVYIDLPTGQASWHYHDSHAHLFEHLPPYRKQWDGHTTEQKYERVAALTAKPQPTVDEIVVWFNAWLREPINDRDRVIISESIGHALRHSPDIYRANDTAERRAAELADWAQQSGPFCSTCKCGGDWHYTGCEVGKTRGDTHFVRRPDATR